MDVKVVLRGSTAVYERSKGCPWKVAWDALTTAGAAWDKEARHHHSPVLLAGSVILSLKRAGLRVTGSSSLIAALVALVDEADAWRVGARRACAEMPLRLFPHQLTGAEWLAQRRSAVLGDDTGLGKSAEVAAALGSRRRAMVLCPSSLRSVWANELARGRLAPVALEAFAEPADGTAAVLNYDRIPASVEADDFRWMDSAEGLALVLDEAHLCLGGSHRAARVGALVRWVLDRGGSAWAVTATPLVNRPTDLWRMLSVLRLEREAFGSWMHFAACFRGRKTPFGWDFGTPDDALLAPSLRRVMFRRLKRDVAAAIPPKRKEKLLFDVSREGVEAIESALTSRGLDVDAVADAVERSAGEDITLEEWSTVRRALALAKVPTALETVARLRAAGERVVVFSSSPDVCAMVAKQAQGRWGVITGAVSSAKRGRVVEAFQRGDLDGVALTVKTGGVGLTLTSARYVVSIDREWTDVANTQAEDRVHRLSQTREVIVIELVARHPLDEHIDEVLARKSREASAVSASAITLDSATSSALDDAREVLKGVRA